MEFLPLMVVLLGGASPDAIVSSFDDDDDGDRDWSTELDPTDDPDDPATPAVTGTDGDDTVVAQGDDDKAWQFDMASAGEVAGLENETTGDAYGLGLGHPFDPAGGSAPVDTLPGLTVVDPGAGNDSVTASGQDALVYDSEGANTIDATGLKSGLS